MYCGLSESLFRDLEKRNYLVSDNVQRLLITFGKPDNRSALGDTTSRWICDTLQQAGIDTKVYTTHGTRTAATSKAEQVVITSRDILKKAGWCTHRRSMV